MKLATILALLGSVASMAEPIPQSLWGRWTIKRVLPTTSISCWDYKQAKKLIGTELEYSARVFRWNTVITNNPVAQVRTITAAEFHDENSGNGALSSQVTFKQLGLKSPQAVQIEILHPPAEITGGSIDIPGDRVLFKDRNTIILSACEVFFEAKRKEK